MRFKNATIHIDTIDTTDTFYRITTAEAVGDLVDSIKAVGLLHPPILLRSESSYRIVSGFRRVSALSASGFSHIDARVLQDVDDHLQISKIAITDNAHQRDLNIVEKTRALKLLSACMDDTNEISRLATTLGVPCDVELLKKYLKISGVLDRLQEGLLEGYVAMPVALALADVGDRSLNRFLNMFRILRVSLNRQREFIALVTEIANRDDTDPAHLIEENFITDVLYDDTLDRNQKTKRLLKRLKKIRYPEITKTEEKFNRHVMNLKLDNRMKLFPPREFEGTNYLFQFTFKNLNEIASLKSRLDRIINDPEFAKALDR